MNAIFCRYLVSAALWEHGFFNFIVEIQAILTHFLCPLRLFVTQPVPRCILVGKIFFFFNFCILCKKKINYGGLDLTLES